MPSTLVPDVIRDLLSAYRLSATVYPPVNSCGSWSLGTSGARKCVFHLIGRGSCWMHLRSEAPMRLEAGDFALLPRNAWHNLAGVSGAVSITCGYFDFSDARGNPILEALPDLVIVAAREQADRKRIEDLIGLLGAEAGTTRAGGSLVLDKLVELLFALAVRGHLESSQEKRGLLAMLSDPRIGRALGAIHREPERSWRLNTLAAVAGMSRTVFADAFSERVGVPPMQYLAAWRMRRAAALLRDRRNSVGRVASQLGYRSEAAFRRAFKRFEGVAAGAMRPAAGDGHESAFRRRTSQTAAPG